MRAGLTSRGLVGLARAVGWGWVGRREGGDGAEGRAGGGRLAGRSPTSPGWLPCVRASLRSGPMHPDRVVRSWPTTERAIAGEPNRPASASPPNHHSLPRPEKYMLRAPVRALQSIAARTQPSVRTMSLFNTSRLQGSTILITGASGGPSPARLSCPPPFDSTFWLAQPQRADALPLLRCCCCCCCASLSTGIGKATAILFAKVRRRPRARRARASVASPVGRGKADLLRHLCLPSLPSPPIRPAPTCSCSPAGRQSSRPSPTSARPSGRPSLRRSPAARAAASPPSSAT